MIKVFLGWVFVFSSGMALANPKVATMDEGAGLLNALLQCVGEVRDGLSEGEEISSVTYVKEGRKTTYKIAFQTSEGLASEPVVTALLSITVTRGRKDVSCDLATR